MFSPCSTHCTITKIKSKSLFSIFTTAFSFTRTYLPASFRGTVFMRMWHNKSPYILADSIGIEPNGLVTTYRFPGGRPHQLGITIHSIWLERHDSNVRPADSKSIILPLNYSPKIHRMTGPAYLAVNPTLPFIPGFPQSKTRSSVFFIDLTYTW